MLALAQDCFSSALDRPDGAAIISTPNFDSLSRRLLGRRWALISPAEHVHLFTLRSLLWLLRATNFRPYKLESDCNISPGLVHGKATIVVKSIQKMLDQAANPNLRPVLYKFALGDEIHSIAVQLED